MSAEATGSPGEAPVYGVGEFLAGLRRLLEDSVGRVWVVGEISNLFRASSGHRYFSLKDDDGQVRAVLFRGAAQRLTFDLEEGLEVLVYAEVSVYQQRGDLQLVVRQLEPRGTGALQLALEQLRRRLSDEGLFDPGRKRSLPGFPRRVGVVTSAKGAAVRDVIRVASGRFAATPLLISATRVQGDGADREVVAALERVAREPEIDVVLLVRGGGSLEDLAAFNSERVARAVVACPVPVVCGVGHEVDVTLADLAADARASTPSAAAMLALPDGAALRDRLLRTGRAQQAAIRTLLARARATLRADGEALRVLAPAARLRAQRERLVRADRAMLRAVSARAERRRSRLSGGVGRLDSLSPLAVLGRGYALVRRASDRRVVRSGADVAVGDQILVRVAQARVDARVERVEEVVETPAGSRHDR